MAALHEFPPILRGNEQEQLFLLRDYLVRLAQSLNAVDSATIVTSSTSDKVTRRVTDDLKQQAADLRSLIIKTADALDVRIETNAEGIDDINGTISTLGNTYVSQSAFGTYKESVLTTIRNTARGVVESYGYSAQISALNDSLDSLSGVLDLLNGEIRRGIVRDPSTGQDVLGIAISQSLVFSSSETGPDGQTYYRIDSSLAQTFGLYTSTGWQFWINGRKVGWFDSTSSSALHVASAIIESGLRFGEDWILDQNSNGIGFRYIGS